MSDLSDQPNLWTRVTRVFKRSGPGDSLLPVRPSPQSPSVPAGPFTPVSVRTSLFRPWARRDAAIANLQKGFEALTHLMTAVRENLEQQTRQQEEIVKYLSHLPDLVQTLPEASQTQVETLRAIHQQMAYQSQQQNRLGNVLEKLSDAATDQGRLLHSLNDRTETLEHHDQMVSENLTSVSIAMQSVSRNSEQGTQVLQTLREQFEQRDAAMQHVMNRQTSRFTLMLAIAIVVSTVALIAVVVMGWLLLHQEAKQSAPAAAAAPATQSVPVDASPATALPNPASTAPSL
jgi:hypothetical protein